MRTRNRSEQSLKPRHGASRRSDRRPGEQPGEVDQIQAVREVGDFKAQHEPATILAPDVEAETGVDRNVRTDARPLEVDLSQDFRAVLEHERGRADLSQLELDGKATAVPNGPTHPDATADVPSSLRPNRV